MVQAAETRGAAAQPATSTAPDTVRARQGDSSAPDWATIAIGAGTLLLAAATCGLWVFAAKQARDMREQLAYVNAQRIKSLADQLFEFDKLHIAYPRLQLELEKLNEAGGGLLKRPKDEVFVQLKAFIYMHLNFFDEIISTYQDRPGESAAIEFEDWQGYIIGVMQHPVYKEVFEAESANFGKQLQEFVEKNKDKIKASTGQPWVF
jgi:hypothetical protein